MKMKEYFPRLKKIILFFQIVLSNKSIHCSNSTGKHKRLNLNHSCDMVTI